MPTYKLEIQLYQKVLLKRLQREKLPWRDDCGDICCSLTTRSDEDLYKPDTFLPEIDFAPELKGGCKLTVTRLTEGQPQIDSLATPPQLHHFTSRVNGNVRKDLTPHVLEWSPLPKLVELVNKRWESRNEHGGLLERDINAMYDFMRDLGCDLARVLVGKQCCICFGPCDIGRETRLSMGPCTAEECQLKFENPEVYGLFPTMDRHRAPIDDMSQNFLILVFVAFLKVPHMHKSERNRLKRNRRRYARNNVQEMKKRYSNVFSPLLECAKLPAHLPQGDPDATRQRMLRLLERKMEPQGNVGTREDHDNLIRWIRRTHHGFLYHVDPTWQTAEKFGEILGNRHVILVKPSSEARMAAFHELKQRSRFQTAFGFHGSPLYFWHTILRNELGLEPVPPSEPGVFLGQWLPMSEGYTTKVPPGVFTEFARWPSEDEASRSVVKKYFWPWSESQYGPYVACVALVEYVQDFLVPRSDPSERMVTEPKATIVRALIVSIDPDAAVNNSPRCLDTRPIDLLNLLGEVKRADPRAAELLDWLPRIN